MSMCQCPVCKQQYSNTYKNCPFCEEEAALRKGKKPRHGGGRRVAKGGFDPSGAIITILVLAILGTGVYFFFGDDIARTFGIRDNQVVDQDPPVSGDEEQQPTTGDEEQDPVDPNGGSGEENPPADPNGGEDKPPVEPDPPANQDPPSVPATAVALHKEDITISRSLGLTAKLIPSGGSGTYTWYSENTNIATVTGGGVVTGLSSGMTNIVVSDGYTTATCIVRVNMN